MTSPVRSQPAVQWTSSTVLRPGRRAVTCGSTRERQRLGHERRWKCSGNRWQRQQCLTSSCRSSVSRFGIWSTSQTVFVHGTGFVLPGVWRQNGEADLHGNSGCMMLSCTGRGVEGKEHTALHMRAHSSEAWAALFLLCDEKCSIGRQVKGSERGRTEKAVKGSVKALKRQ